MMYLARQYEGFHPRVSYAADKDLPRGARRVLPPRCVKCGALVDKGVIICKECAEVLGRTMR
jgi:hypothetical protein